MLQEKGEIRSAIATYHSGITLHCKYCNSEGVIVAGEAGENELELVYSETQSTNSVVISGYAICRSCKEKILTTFCTLK